MDKQLLHLIDDEQPDKSLIEELRVYSNIYDESMYKIYKLLDL